MSRPTTLLALSLGFAGAAPAQTADPDRDRDGLSDFHELHKHFTDPRKADSDGDGVPDGDWEERREYAYTVRTIVQVLPPVTRDVLCDDYQDARILEERPDYVELEVIHYPLNRVADAITADPDWRRRVAARADLKPFLAPGRTSNWTPAMRGELVAALARDGIEVAALDDRTLVERASKWLFDNTRFADGFTTYCSTFEGGRARVLPGLEAAAERGRHEKGLTLEEQWERELFAEGMWRHRIHGSCTSSAIFLNGCMRALGVPSRIVLCMPLVDGSDPREVGWLRTKLTHHRVRRIVRDGIEPLGDSWANHTFNEVYVGGRWRRLNYSKLGQDILDERCFGLMTHLATFHDWSDGEMARTWGLRQNGDRKAEDVFGGSNPYSCIALSDRFGVHANLDNPAPPEHRTLTVTKAYWFDSPERTVDVTLRGRDPAGLFLLHVDECFADGGLSQYADFDAAADHRLVLQAEGEPDVRAEIARRCWWLDAANGVHEFLAQIEADDLARMNRDAAWRIVPRNEGRDHRWAVADGVVLARRPEPSEGAGEPRPEAAPAAGERVLTLDAVQWSDDPRTPEWIRKQRFDPPRLLGHVAAWNDFAEIKRLTIEGDTRFFLEAEGHPSLKVGVSPGGFSQGEGPGKSAWVVIELGPGDWRDFVRGVSYVLRPQNGKKGYRWIVAEGVVVPPRS